MSGTPVQPTNSTTGLAVAAYVQVSGSGVVANLTTKAGTGENTGTNGYPNPGNYTLTLSLGGTATCQLTPSLVDVDDQTVTPSDESTSWTYKSYNNPSGSGVYPPSWYKPSPFTSLAAPAVAYSADVASVSSSGLITALAVGQAIIEVAYPVFDNDLGTNPEGEPDNFIYTQIVVTVTP
jgi:hypothetical protein